MTCKSFKSKKNVEKKEVAGGLNMAMLWKKWISDIKCFPFLMNLFLKNSKFFCTLTRILFWIAENQPMFNQSP